MQINPLTSHTAPTHHAGGKPKLGASEAKPENASFADVLKGAKAAAGESAAPAATLPLPASPTAA